MTEGDTLPTWPSTPSPGARTWSWVNENRFLLAVVVVPALLVGLAAWWIADHGGAATADQAERLENLHFVSSTSSADQRLRPFRNMDLSGMNLTALQLDGADFTEARLIDARLESTKLDHAVFIDARLSGADLKNAVLPYAQLDRANLSAADLSGADLSYVHLDGAYLDRADLHFALLRGADLHGANLRGADLTNADLTGADLSNAYLSGAILAGADLSGATLSEATMGNASLCEIVLSGGDVRVIYDDATTWPDWFNPSPSTHNHFNSRC